jgi:HD-GYP domain-containing protein (c-di-GMP phosphodiesterase class II)
VRAVAGRCSWRTPAGETAPILTDDEVENLCVSRGTLNAREREIINHHVVASIEMLEQLPYPRSLRNVPAIAGAHHERMDGHGYPRGLVRDQISLQGRILGLADVFEALTARDRPYKPGMSLGRALSILESMRDEGHIDGDLFEVFVRSKVYLRYAAEYLDPEQIDDELIDEVTRSMLTARRLRA